MESIDDMAARSLYEVLAEDLVVHSKYFVIMEMCELEGFHGNEVEDICRDDEISSALFPGANFSLRHTQ